MKIEEFLNLKEEERLNYDFSDDCDYTRNSDYKKIKEYEKYFAYKTLKGVGDPDTSSQLLQEIYKILWPELMDENHDYMRDKEWIRSDTMTSVQHTLSKYYEEIFSDDVKDYKKKHPKQRYISVNMCKEMYEQYDSVSTIMNENKKLKQFISDYHTLGNYCPVPTGFNVARSGGWGTYDYWDLTLMKIKGYFDKRPQPKAQMADDITQIAMLLHCDEMMSNCLKWLDGYENWNEFVEKNYFQDYVGENGEVIPFCEGHSWENNEISNYNAFFSEVSKRIEKRSKKMIKALEEKIHQMPN
jgi:hypothetical protein